MAVAETYYSEREGVNSRLDEVQAAILDVKLRHLHDHLAARLRVAAEYEQQISAEIVRPRTAATTGHSYHLFVIETSRRAAVIERLKSELIGYGIHYPTPIHLMSGYRFLGYAAGDLPHTERAAESRAFVAVLPGVASGCRPARGIGAERFSPRNEVTVVSSSGRVGQPVPPRAGVSLPANSGRAGFFALQGPLC